MVKYTEQDAMLYIVAWQIPAAFMFAVRGVWCELAQGRFKTSCAQYQVVFATAFLMFCWVTTVAILVFLDMLILPPLFALIRLSYSLSWGFA